MQLLAARQSPDWLRDDMDRKVKSLALNFDMYRVSKRTNEMLKIELLEL